MCRNLLLHLPVFQIEIQRTNIPQCHKLYRFPSRGKTIVYVFLVMPFDDRIFPYCFIDFLFKRIDIGFVDDIRVGKPRRG